MIPSILSVVIVIAVLIIIHEFGHLIVAKLSGVPVEIFSVGFGPALIRKKIKDTVYQLSAIPLGGYIKMLGEETEVEGGFLTKPTWKKIAVVVAGPISNLILGFILTFILFLNFGIRYAEPRVNVLSNSWEEKSGLKKGDLILKIDNDSIKTYNEFEDILAQSLNETLAIKVQRNDSVKMISFLVESESTSAIPFIRPIIGRVKRGGPAYRIGLKTGDEIKLVAERPVSDWEDFVQTIRTSAGKKVLVQWQRKNSIFQDSVVPELVPDELTGDKIGQIGIWVALPKQSLSLFSSLGEAGNRCIDVVTQTFVIIYKVIIGKISRKAIGGPIMVAKITYEGVSWGAEYFIALWALLSINLCVVNLFPIPVLDGGRVLIFIIEAFRRKRLTQKQLGIALNIGWALILLLIFFTLFNDILRIIRP
jgi:regulator of sigma E protease